MKHGAVSSSRPATSRVVTHDGMFSVRIIVICFKKLLGIGRGVQLTNIVYRGNINVIWKRIRGIPGSFFSDGYYHQYKLDGYSNMV